MSLFHFSHCPVLSLVSRWGHTTITFADLKKDDWTDLKPLEPVWLSGQSILRLQVHLYAWVHVLCVYMCMCSVCVCVCGHINACMHVASSEEQWCVHYHHSEPRASPALMAVIIKKAFRVGCVTKGGMVGVVLGWLVQQSDQGWKSLQKYRMRFCIKIPEKFQTYRHFLNL